MPVKKPFLASILAMAVVIGAPASAQGRLRETHLRYHLTMMEVLSAEQVDEYNRLRSYR